MSVATLRTRKPTGKPSWPIVLLAGAEKTGKSFTAARASSSNLVSRTYWVTIGEDQPDEYGQLGDFDIVEHDGTYQAILGALRLIAAQPVPEAGPPLLVVDSMTRLWDLITGNAQEIANQRARKKGRGNPDADAQITMDLWNAAKDQWTHVMDAVRAFPGPVVLTARLDVVAVMDDNGQPTKERTTKVQAHKSLPYDVGAVIEMPARGDTWISGVRSVRLQLAERTKAPKDFGLDWFWRQLGLEGDDTSTREHQAPRTDAAPPAEPLPYVQEIGDEWAAQVNDVTVLGSQESAGAIESDTLAGVFLRAKNAGVLDRYVDDPAKVAEPQTVRSLIRRRGAAIREANQRREEVAA